MPASGGVKVVAGRVRLGFYAAKLLVQVAQNLLLAALFVNAGMGEDAAISLSAVFLAAILPSVLFGLAGGALADRIGPARGFVLGSTVRAVAIAGGLFVAGDFGPTWAIAFGFALGTQVSQPSEMALIKTLQAGSASRMHGLVVALQYSGQGIGVLVLAPTLYFLGGTEAMLAGALVAATAVAALATMLAVRLRGTPACTAQPARAAFSFRETCRFFADHPQARYAVAVTTFKVIISRGVMVALPIYLARDIGLGNEALVFLFLPGVAGAAIGLFWASRSVSLERAQPTMRLALAGMILSVVALAVFDYGIQLVTQHSQIGPIARLEASMNTTFAVAIPVAFLLGLSLSGALIAGRVALTETAPPAQQARVYATQATLTEAILILPMVLTGLGTEFAGARVTLGSLGAVAFLALAALELPRILDALRGATASAESPV